MPIFKEQIMTDKAKTEALEMIRAAEKGCSKVHEAWSSALKPCMQMSLSTVTGSITIKGND